MSFPPPLFPEGVGAAALGFERPNRFITARAGVRVHGENPRRRTMYAFTTGPLINPTLARHEETHESARRAREAWFAV